MLGIVIILAAAAVSIFVGALGHPLIGMGIILGTGVLAILFDRSLYTIYGVEGEHKTPYMTRLVLGRLRLHIFWRGDQDPDPHDHPWGFWTFPLVSYVEEVTMPPDESMAFSDFLGLDPGVLVSQQVVQRFRFHYRPATHTHRVLGAVERVEDPTTPADAWERTDRPVVTIVWTEKVSRPWGFFKHRDGIFCWVPWRRYIYEGGKDAPCSENPGDEGRE